MDGGGGGGEGEGGGYFIKELHAWPEMSFCVFIARNMEVSCDLVTHILQGLLRKTILP